MSKTKHPTYLGLSPGSMIYTGQKREERSKVTALHYSSNFLHELHEPSSAAIAKLVKEPGVKWIHIEGIHDTELVRDIGDVFKLHPLVMDDIVNPRQRPKVEEYQNYLFIVIKNMQMKEELGTEQIAVILMDSVVITFRQEQNELFTPLRKRLGNATGRLRSHGADYLAYAILDLIVDHYFQVIKDVGETVKALDDELDGRTDNHYFLRIKECKRKVFTLRQIVLPSREVMSTMVHHPFHLIQADNQAFFRDVYDHLHQAMDNVEIFKDLLAEQTQLYMFNLSNNLNSVMKVLTIIGTIFIPLTFISSLYGMNFKYMPELEWRYGYPAALIAMFVIGLLLYLYFRTKNWL